MSSPKPRSNAKRPTWFQDTKSGCEKQSDYFLKIRKLQKELINREQHNLVNAMERLKQLQYPRRRPLIRNFPPPVKGASTAFPRRSTRSLHGHKHIGLIEKDKMLKPLKGQHLLPNKSTSVEDEDLGSFSLEDIRYLYNRMLPVLNDQQIAKIASEVRSTFPNEPSTYLLQPHLPSIPNVKRKTTIRLENRLKLLTLSEESQYRTLSVPKIATSLSLHKKRLPHDSSHHEIDEEKKTKKSEKRNILCFDVDPNDSSVFGHVALDNHVDDDEFDDGDDASHVNGPLPPPNSRPNSTIAGKNPELDQATDHEQSCDVSLDANQIAEKAEETTITERSPPSEAGESREKNTTENNEEEEINEEQAIHVVNEENAEVTASEEETAETQPTENTTNDDIKANQELNDNKLSDINIAEPKVIIKTNKPPTETSDERDEE